MASRTNILFDIIIFLALTASCTLCILIALAISLQSVSALAITAASVNLFSLIWTTIVLILHIARRRFLRLYIVLISLFISSASSALTLVFLFWADIKLMKGRDQTFLPNIETFVNVEYALWGLGVILQFIFFVNLLQKSNDNNVKNEKYNIRDSDRILPEIRAQSPLLASPFFSSRYQGNADTPSPTVSNPSFFDNRSSMQSPTQMSQPNRSSQTWLRHESLPPRPQDVHPTSFPLPPGTEPLKGSSSFERPRTNNRPSTPSRTRLETIPGSNPNSPGRTLEKALPAKPAAATIQDVSEPNSAPRSRASSGSSHYSKREARVPPRFRRDSTPSQTSPAIINSPMAVDESHIHPLFRTSSPTPAPTPTISTTVTASAFGGQSISANSFSRASSRAASPDSKGRARSGSFTRPNLRSRSDSGASGSAAMIRSKSLEAVASSKTSWFVDDNEVPPVPSTPTIIGAVGDTLVVQKAPDKEREEEKPVPGAWPLAE